jgi:hypothetical protein
MAETLILSLTILCTMLLCLIVVRGWVFEITSLLNNVISIFIHDKELHVKIIEKYGKSDRSNEYAAFLINSMVEFRNTAFRDPALATKFDEIISLWKTFAEKKVNE